MYRQVENAQWQIVRTARGYHVRLVGANGEPVIWSEPYTDQATAEEAIRITRRATGRTRVVDERG